MFPTLILTETGDEMGEWTEFRSLVQRITAIGSFLTNSLLVTLIIHKSPKCFGAYRYLMIYISVFEFGYATIDLLLRPEVVTKDSSWLVIFDSNTTFIPFEAMHFCLLIWLGAFGVTMANFGVHFAFRYLVLIGKRKWTSSGGFRICIWLSISVIYGGIYALAAHIFNSPTEQLDAFISRELENFREVQPGNVVYVGFSFYEKVGDSQEETINWFNVTGVLIMSSLILISCVLMFFFGTKCYLEIKNMTMLTTSSSQAKSLQNQLFFALFFQTMIPMILMHIPSSIVLLKTLFGGIEEVYGKILTVTVALFPAIDPLPSFIIIEAYRNAIIDCFSFVRKCGKSKESGSDALKTSRTSF